MREITPQRPLHSRCDTWCEPSRQLPARSSPRSCESSAGNRDHSRRLVVGLCQPLSCLAAAGSASLHPASIRGNPRLSPGATSEDLDIDAHATLECKVSCAVVIEGYTSVEQALHGRLGTTGDLLDEASRSEAGDRVGGDHVGGHGQYEADHAAEESAQGGDDEHDQRVDGECAAMTLGSTKFSSTRLEASTTMSMTAALASPPSPRATITASPHRERRRCSGCSRRRSRPR
jgi:hypothetical protein